MKITSLLYHDVVENGKLSESGFNGSGPDSYKLNIDNFNDHVENVAESLKGGTDHLNILINNRINNPADFNLITFDDGGVSFLTRIAPILEQHQLRGVFFISTNFIGTPGFMDREMVKELYDRGHIIGSHSHTHPKMISKLSYNELLEEWSKSKSILSEITGHEIQTASIPGGFFSNDVAKSAAEAGYRILFTSEPVRNVARIEKCIIAGRFSIKRGDTQSKAKKIIINDPLFAAIQWMSWNGKKLVKRILGKSYLKLREKLLK